jgi:hypothetical protein
MVSHLSKISVSWPHEVEKNNGNGGGEVPPAQKREKTIIKQKRTGNENLLWVQYRQLERPDRM